MQDRVVNLTLACFIVQIIEKAGPIPWDALKLPEGRTKKAVQVMIDKEKQKVKRAREAEGNGDDVQTSGKVSMSDRTLLNGRPR